MQTCILWFLQEEKPSSEKPDESKPEVAASDQSAGAGEKPRENADGSGNQEEMKKEEERPQLTIEQKVRKYKGLKVRLYEYKICPVKKFDFNASKCV